MNPKLHPEEDQVKAIAVLKGLGFNPPACAYFKRDPRGSEYGYYRVDLVDEDYIRVTHVHEHSKAQDPDPTSKDDFTFVFRDTYGFRTALENFRRWAKEST